MIIALIATGAALHFARDLTMPVALAFFFAVILSPAVERLRRLAIPNSIAAAMVMLVVLGAMAGLVRLTMDPARAWFERAPSVLQDLETKLRPIQQVAVRLDKVAAQAERVAGGASQSSADATM